MSCWIVTENGHLLTAVGGGGRTTDTFHSDATRASTWEEFQFNSLGDDYYDIRAYDGHFVTAVNGGGLSSGDTLHTNATHVGSWETFQVHCASRAFNRQSASANLSSAASGMLRQARTPPSVRA